MEPAMDYITETYLDKRLEAYAKENFYPFHMPGHKRMSFAFPNPYQIDITEIEGFDNLHHANDILLSAQERLGNLYGSKKSYYLVNGSTCGLLGAIGGLTTEKDQILIARNCHKSVYNAVKIFHLKAEYVYPKLLTCGIQGAVLPCHVEEVLKRNQKIKVVVVTSPTYDGIVSDIEQIAKIAHKYHAYLIVDEAHGAHLPFHSFFPESALTRGADVVVQSLHKTLPAFTQTAALHIAGERIGLKEQAQIEEMLELFQTSSPSYILMAGIDRCVRYLQESGPELFSGYVKKLSDFYEKTKKLQYLKVLRQNDYEKSAAYAVDPSKIVVTTRYAHISGEQLYMHLYKRKHIQLEMFSAQYVVAMTSLMDSKEGFQRLIDALYEIDKEIAGKSSKQLKGIAEEPPSGQLREITEKPPSEQFIKNGSLNDFMNLAYGKRKKELEIADCQGIDKKIVNTPLDCCEGKICAEYIYLYPPGIPMIVPGEVLDQDLLHAVAACKEHKLKIQGKALNEKEPCIITMEETGKIFCLMGKSATGKDTVFEKLLQQTEVRLKRIVPGTTRPKRDFETDGVEYCFYTEKELEELKSQGKIIELRSYQTIHGIWNYFTVAKALNPLENYLLIGTLESYEKLCSFYGKNRLVPIYLELADEIRLQRALDREKEQKEPKYKEMCRRYLSDEEDFSEQKLEQMKLERRFENLELSATIREILDYIKEECKV